MASYMPATPPKKSRQGDGNNPPPDNSYRRSERPLLTSSSRRFLCASEVRNASGLGERLPGYLYLRGREGDLGRRDSFTASRIPAGARC